MLYGKYELLEELTAYKVRPADDLSRTLLDVLEETPGVTVHGLTDRSQVALRRSDNAQRRSLIAARSGHSRVARDLRG